jgi:hypothetical protein
MKRWANLTPSWDANRFKHPGCSIIDTYCNIKLKEPLRSGAVSLSHPQSIIQPTTVIITHLLSIVADMECSGRASQGRDQGLPQAEAHSGEKSFGDPSEHYVGQGQGLGVPARSARYVLAVFSAPDGSFLYFHSSPCHRNRVPLGFIHLRTYHTAVLDKPADDTSPYFALRLQDSPTVATSSRCTSVTTAPTRTPSRYKQEPVI